MNPAFPRYLDKSDGQSGKDAVVGAAHGLVSVLRRLDRVVKGVHVVHHKLAAAHQAKSGPNFVAEFASCRRETKDAPNNHGSGASKWGPKRTWTRNRTGLVEAERQLPPGRHLRRDQVRDLLLVRRAEQVVHALTILQPEELASRTEPPADRARRRRVSRAKHPWEGRPVGLPRRRSTATGLSASTGPLAVASASPAFGRLPWVRLLNKCKMES